MIPRILAVAGPMVVYISLAVLGAGLWRERKKLEWLAGAPALAALVISFAALAPVHRLFFDEDIYINIASNLTHTPAAQVTLLGGPGDVEVSSYYKEPPGWPVLLSLVFLITEPSEFVAFALARLLFALAIAAVYQLAREALPLKRQAVAAAMGFAAAAICFRFSVSAGTDIPAALFSILGLWGCFAGNGPLAAAGLALAAQTRMELLGLIPLIWLARKVPVRWKVLAAALTAAEVVHIGWVMSVAPLLAEAEKVPSAFSMTYVPANLATNLKYLLNPLRFPALIVVVAVAQAFRRRVHGLLVFQAAVLFSIYLVFYAGSFQLNPRYSIQFLAPLAVLAASAMERPVFIGAVMLSLFLPYTQPPEFSGYLEALAADHRLAVQFASQLGPGDLVLSAEPQIFLNQGIKALDSTFAYKRPEKLKEVMRRPQKVWYHAGVRTAVADSPEWRADQWVKSHLELHPIHSAEIAGMRIAYYEATEVGLQGSLSESRPRKR